MDIKIKHSVNQEMVIQTIAFMMYYNIPKNQTFNHTNIKKELTELLHDRGWIGTTELLKEERFQEYLDKARWEYEELGLKGERRKQLIKQQNQTTK